VERLSSGRDLVQQDMTNLWGSEQGNRVTGLSIMAEGRGHCCKGNWVFPGYFSHFSSPFKLDNTLVTAP